MKPRRFNFWLPMVLAVGLQAGCGGGNSTAPVSLNISGTAATGAAIAGGTVALKCTAGAAGTVTTDINGNFSVSPSGITFPCVGRVDYKDSSGASQKLHTFISKPGVANITPISELIVASLTGTTAANAFDNFDTVVKPKSFAATQVTAAIVTVKAYLKSLGLAVDDIPSDPLGTAVVATGNGVAGDKFDKVLDALGVLLTKNKQKLSDLVATFITSTSPSQALAGYPATAVYVGKLSDGSACTINVAADHSITASAPNWAYTGASIKANLSGTYYSSDSGADIGFGLLYSGKSNFYGATAGDPLTATKTTPAFQVGLNLDATSGKFISAQGNAITDSSYFFAKANFDFTCAGEAYPAGGAIPPSEFFKAPASEFKATSFVGTFNAPDFSGQPPVLTSCTITVDSVGNTTLTSPNFTGGALAARYTYLNTSNGVVNDVNNATYDFKLGPDRYTIFLRNISGVRAAQVTINGLGSGVSSKGEKALTCSTANDPGPGLAAYLAKAGTYKGIVSGFNFSNNPNSPVCNVTISAAGVTTYTDSLGVVRSVTSNAANPPQVTVDAVYGTNYDLQPDGNFAITFDTPATTRDSSTNQLLGDRLFYAKPGASESCLQLKKQ